MLIPFGVYDYRRPATKKKLSKERDVHEQIKGSFTGEYAKLIIENFPRFIRASGAAGEKRINL